MNTRSTLDITTPNYEIRYEPGRQLVWSSFKYPERPCMSYELLSDIASANKAIESFVKQGLKSGEENPLLFQVAHSTTPGVFNLGGDLAHFIELIRGRDQAGLMQYGKACIDVLYPFSTGFDLPFTTISLVEGEALGGGFETALASKVLIAEEGATFGFPETMFGLFPGMGAFSFLARKLNPSLAKRIIASGKIYSAAELYEMGIVDRLVPNGEGRQAVYDFIKHQRSRSIGMHSLDRVMAEFNPVSYEELMNVVTIWVDTAMQLSEKNIRVMEYLVRAQQRRWGSKAVEVVSLEKLVG